jgi:hypothetical protein
MTTETKYFNVHEANRTLPLVKKIVRDILDASIELKLYADEIGKNPEEDPRVKRLIIAINGFIAELEEIGCQYKDWNFKLGLVDFPAMINGQEVFLCWKSDEENIRYYHALDSGFAGRKLIPEEYLTD